MSEGYTRLDLLAMIDVLSYVLDINIVQVDALSFRYN